MITYPDSEELVLGSLLKSDCWDEVSFLTEDCFSTAANREIFREFRAKDDSHLFPILGRFNATERAIRRLRRLELELWLENEISKIINEEV